MFLITFSLWMTRPTRHDTPESYPQLSRVYRKSDIRYKTPPQQFGGDTPDLVTTIHRHARQRGEAAGRCEIYLSFLITLTLYHRPIRPTNNHVGISIPTPLGHRPLMYSEKYSLSNNNSKFITLHLPNLVLIHFRLTHQG